jgi:SanA protein
MLFKLLLTLIISGAALVLLPRLFTGLYTLFRVYTVDEVPVRRVAVIFGAGLKRDGTPTAVLADRIETGAQLYFTGKVEKLLMSGDNRFEYYNEPEAMRQYALKLGVPDSAIVLDYAGRRTYDTCYRAKAIFGLTETILVTQAFHMPRALYTCNALGLKALGVEANNNYYLKRSLIFWNVRELGATLSALIDVHLTHPQPVLGNPEPIFPSAQ